MPDSENSAPGSEVMRALDAAGIPSTLKGRAQRLLFRVVAGSVGLEYWAKIRDNLDTIEGRSRINAMLAEEVGRQAIADPEMIERAKARFLGEIGRKQENIEAVAREANVKLLAAPIGEEQETEDATEPSQDWMNTFVRQAEDASSEELRRRLAAILAGEARKTGTFSRSTIRYIAEVEKDVLEDFQRALEYRVGDTIYTGEDWNSGDWFRIGRQLESEGLISGSSGFTSMTLTLGDNGISIATHRKLGMAIRGKPGHETKLSCWLLTKIGIEVASLLEPKDELLAFQSLASRIKKNDIDQIVVGPFTNTGQGQTTVHAMMVLWDKEHDRPASDNT